MTAFCSPMDYSPPGASVRGILQTILEWVAISSGDLPQARIMDDANHQHLGQPLLSQAQAADKDT